MQSPADERRKVLPPTPSQGPSWTRLLIGLLALALAILGWLASRRTPSVGVAPAGRSAAAPRQHSELAKRLDDALARTDAACRTATSRRLAAARRAVEAGCVQARGGVDGAVAELCGSKNSAVLIWLMASDTVRKTARTDAHVQSVLDPAIMAPCLQGMATAEKELGRLQGELSEISTAFAVELAAITESSAPAAGVDSAAWESLCQSIHESQTRVRKIAQTKIAGQVGLGLSALFIRSTMISARKVFGHIVKRLVATQAVAIGTAAADGPFPVGDLIALIVEAGGVGLSVYDLHKARNVMIPELKQHLNTAINSVRADALNDVEGRFGTMLEAFETHNHGLVATLKEDLR